MALQLVCFLLGLLTLSVSGQSLSDIACNPDTRPAILTNATGYITTPNFPQNYPDDTHCEWLIIAQTGEWIKLDFDNFYTEATYDIVTVYDGFADIAPILGGFEGIYDPAPYGVVSTQQYMLITFTSDPFTNRLGFGASFASVAPFDQQDACAAISRPQLLQEYSGTITTKNYPGNYWNHQTCQWTIEAQEAGATVSLKINRFYTDLNSDYVYIYNGANTQSPLIARISGPRDSPGLPIIYQSTGMYMTVVFTSNELLSRFGFTADYTTVPAKSTV